MKLIPSSPFYKVFWQAKRSLNCHELSLAVAETDQAMTEPILSVLSGVKAELLGQDLVIGTGLAFIS